MFKLRGNMRGSPKKVKNEKADVDGKSMSPLCTYGRDEAYINNKLWLAGVSTIILWGVGDGMIPWCALEKRIPIMCLYDKELHKKTIEAFLLEKIIKRMEEATPEDARWYRTNAQLGCCDGKNDESESGAGTRTKPKTKAKAKAKAKANADGEAAGSGGESSSSSSSSSASPKKKQKKEHTED